MNRLIEAAKAVIADFNYDEDDYPNDQVIANLRAAVERAEKQEAESIKFDERFHHWFIGHRKMLFELGTYDCAEMAWTAAQQAERMRIKDLLKQSSDWFEDDQMAQANWLLEKIDAGEDS